MLTFSSKEIVFHSFRVANCSAANRLDDYNNNNNNNNNDNNNSYFESDRTPKAKMMLAR
jgi:hypothetical protein